MVLVIEVVGGLLSGSLALLADAGHMLTDATGLVLALIGASLGTRAASARRTFGMQRAEVLAALSNALLLVGVAVWVLIQAVDRLREPGEVETSLMLAVAVVGVAGQHGRAVAAAPRSGREPERPRGLPGGAGRPARLGRGDRRGGADHGHRLDPVRRPGLAADLRADRAPRLDLLREVVDVLLEATPRGVDLDQVRQHIREVPGVVDVHDLHVWTITSGVPVLSAHVVVDDACIRDGPLRARCWTGWASASAATSTSSTAPSSSSRSGTRTTSRRPMPDADQATFAAPLDVAGRRVLVCGGGPAALGPVRALLEARAEVLVVGPEIGPPSPISRPGAS